MTGLLTALAAALGLAGAFLTALGLARRSGRQDGRAEAERAQDRATLDAVRRRDAATAMAPSSWDEVKRRAKEHRL